MAPEASDQIDSLFEVPPAEFVKARNALAKSLKAAGQRELAGRAAKLTRPTASVWAANQVSRRHPQLVARLAAATETLQAAIARDKPRYAAAIETHRGLLNEARQRIEAVLREGGLRDAPATVAAAVQNLRSGLMDERIRPLVEAGRLEEDVDLAVAGGVFGVSGLGSVEQEPSPPPRQLSAKPPLQRGAKEDDVVRQRTREGRERARAAAKARSAAEHRVRVARKAADAAEAARARHEAAVATARGELERAERALSAARLSEQEAISALAAAHEVLEKLPPVDA